MDVTGAGDTENGFQWSHTGADKVFRVEHRTRDAETVVLAHVRNVFPHHDTLTQFVSRLISESGDGPLAGELVLVDEVTGEVLARRDLRRAKLDPRRPRPSPPGGS